MNLSPTSEDVKLDSLSTQSFHSTHNESAEVAMEEFIPLQEKVRGAFNPMSIGGSCTTLNSYHSATSEPAPTEIDKLSPATTISCRNCWDNEGDLISPCKCSGTNGYVHKECLEAWLRQSGLRICNVCGGSFPLVCRMKPLKEWKIMPPCDHRVVLFFALTLTTLFLIGWLLYGIVSTLVKSAKAKPGDEHGTNDLDVTHYTISFVWLGVIIITWIPLFIGTRKHLVRTYRNWLHQNQVVSVRAYHADARCVVNDSSGAAGNVNIRPV